MPTYVSLYKMTPEGAKEIKGLPKRFEDFRKGVESAGGRLIGAYALMGAYDYLAIMEVPDDAAALTVALKASQKGTTGTQTMRAIAMDEFVKIVQKL